MGIPSSTAAAAAGHGAVPDLTFAVEGAQAVRFAAVPTLALALRLEAEGGWAIRSVTLNVQVRIAATRRRYDGETQTRLRDVFGPVEGWDRALQSVRWAQTSLVVGPFAQSKLVELPVPCTYDFDVAAARYLAAIRDGMVPLDLVFSGTIFYAGEDGRLRTAHIPWDLEARFALPIATWREAMDQHFPDSAWVRLGQDAFDRLSAYKASHVLLSWDAVIDALLPAGEK